VWGVKQRFVKRAREKFDSCSDLLAGVRGEVENQDGEEGNTHARDDQVDRIEEGFATKTNVKRDV
jgi:hypothetical protein